MGIFNHYLSRYVANREEEYSLEQYLELCRDDPSAYASPAERMLTATGTPESIDTRNDPRLSRLFSNKVIRRYPAFEEFYGMEDTIEQIVSFFRHAAQDWRNASRSSICSARSVAASRPSPSNSRP